MSTDTFVVRAVVVFLGTIGLIGMVGGFLLANQLKAIPGELIGVFSAAVGGITGILAKTSSEPSTNVERTDSVNVRTDAGV